MDKHSSSLSPLVSCRENGPNKLERYITQLWKCLQGTNPLDYWAHLEVTQKMTTIFFITFKWAQYVRVLWYIKLESLASSKHSSLSGLFVSYESKKML
jgi:hypothetical protein